jgi:LPPG:FO 2-phospho-L-lactate transferase
VVAVLAGGTGGAKLARGLLEVLGPDRLAVVANTADDVEVHGVHVSPDPDLVLYWLAGRIDERGWGVRDDTWRVMAALEAAGRPTWFRLGDRDLAHCLIRTERLRAGDRLTRAHGALVEALGVRARVLPMADEPVRTHVRSRGSWRPFQEFMVVDGARGPVEGVELRGVEEARPTPEVLQVLGEAEAVVIGPSNPVISIGPILAVPGMRDAVRAAGAPVVAVSPFVGGHAVKGPTDLFCKWAGIELSAQGVLRLYDDVVDGIVADEPVEGRPSRRIDTVMDGAKGRERVARAVLELAAELRRALPADPSPVT